MGAVRINADLTSPTTGADVLTMFKKIVWPDMPTTKNRTADINSVVKHGWPTMRQVRIDQS